MSKVDLALEIAVKAHSGQLDRDGEAYILHPLAVGLMGKTDEERMAGFLHDVLEDSDYTPDNLLELGIPESVVNALILLTHNKNESYNDYITEIRREAVIPTYKPAYIVKLADMKDHLSQTETLTEELKNKYISAMKYLL